ncbi:hypothetical protein [Proteus hauseri]|uniref:hypothetical protein n=1 Tax=Proteus hauseri TaxID=183417 RepID=UPI0032DA3730
MANVKVVDSGIADTFYAINIAFNIDKKNFLLSLNKDKKYETRSILPSGKLGAHIEDKTFQHYYDYMQVIYDAFSNKQYLCCISTENKFFELFIIQNDAKLIPAETYDYIDGFNKTAALFIIDGKFYAYIQRELDRSWEITLRNA